LTAHCPTARRAALSSPRATPLARAPPLQPAHRPYSPLAAPAATSPPACVPLAAPAARSPLACGLLAARLRPARRPYSPRASLSQPARHPLQPSGSQCGAFQRGGSGGGQRKQQQRRKVAALGASESALPGSAPAAALHTFTLDSGASRCFFRGSTTLTPLSALVPVRLADPSGGSVLARSSTILPCLAVASGSLSGLHLPSFSTNLVSTAALLDAMVTTTTPGGQRVSICTCTRTGRHLATFTCWPGSSLYTLTTEPP
ncbi:unnamed protein product, partial [Closterium sp. NIES-54]